MTYLASRARATIPAPCGADADVPVKYFVHLLCRSALTCVVKRIKKQKMNLSHNYMQIMNFSKIMLLFEEIRRC